jgi:hypothetical protein
MENIKIFLGGRSLCFIFLSPDKDSLRREAFQFRAVPFAAAAPRKSIPTRTSTRSRRRPGPCSET